MGTILYLGNAYVYPGPRCRPQPAEKADEPGLGKGDATGRRPNRDVKEDRRSASADDRPVVVVDDREIAVLRGDPPERLAAAAEARPEPAGEVAEAVVRRRARI